MIDKMNDEPEQENSDIELHTSSNEVECNNNNNRQQSQGSSNTQNEVLPKTLPALYSRQKINNTAFFNST